MALELKNISKAYGKQVLFKDLSFSCKTGEVLCISGANGSGKSSLTKIICGQSSSNSGSILLNNKEITSGNFSICSPHTALYEAFTVFELYDFIKQLCPISIQKKDLPEYLMLSKKVCNNRRLEKFSSGMKQRVKLAFAFVHPGEILILDEPSSNLDDQARKWFLDKWNFIKPNKINIIATNNIQQECPFEHNAITLPNYI